MERGIIKSIDRSKGYGFIETESGDKIFFHQRWLRKIKFRDLSEGVEVVFSINNGPRGPRAYHLNLAGQDDAEMVRVRRVEEIFKD